jgi:hypothetical protein
VGVSLRRCPALYQIILGVTTSAVNRLAVSEEPPEVRKYLKGL